MELSQDTQSAVDGLPGMICNSSLFFDRIVAMMIIVCAALPDMNPVDVLHHFKKFHRFTSAGVLQNNSSAQKSIKQ